MSSILYQQLSTKAATTIKGRLYALFPDHDAPPPAGLLALSLEELRAVGVSRQKAGYLQDLASKASTIPSIKELESMEDEEIIQRLIPYQRHRTLVRRNAPDVHLSAVWTYLPVDDMGVQEGMKRLLES